MAVPKQASRHVVQTNQDKMCVESNARPLEDVEVCSKRFRCRELQGSFQVNTGRSGCASRMLRWE